MIEDVEKLLKPVIEDTGLKLDQVNFYKNRAVLEIVIDKEAGVELDDCVLVTKLINPILDEAEFMPENYTLEVVSKGVENE